LITWFSLPSNWNDEPRYLQLCSALQVASTSLPCDVWAFCARSATDGDLSRYSDRQLAAVLRYVGDPALMLKSLKECDYIDARGRIVGWRDLFKLAESYKRRASRAGKASAKARSASRSLSDSPLEERKKEETRGEETRGESHVERDVQHDVPSAGVLAWARDIYAEYPKRVNEDESVTAIAAAITKEGGTFDCATTILLATRAFAKAVSNWRENGDFDYIPYPKNWFSRGGYKDDPAAWVRPRNFRLKREMR
jgi:hypothetical protein